MAPLEKPILLSTKEEEEEVTTEERMKRDEQVQDVTLEDAEAAEAEKKRGSNWVPPLFGNGESSSTPAPPKRSTSPSRPSESSPSNNNKRSSSPKPNGNHNNNNNSNTKPPMPKSALRRKKPANPEDHQADMLKQTIGKKQAPKPTIGGFFRGGLFGSSEQMGESDMNLAFGNYKRSSAVSEQSSDGAVSIVNGSRDSLNSFGGGGGDNRVSTVSWGDNRESTVSWGDNRGSTVSWGDNRGSTVSWGDNGRDSLASAKSRDSVDSRASNGSSTKPRISFWPGLDAQEEDAKSARTANSATSSDGRRNTRISTMRKRDSRARSPRRSQFNTDNEPALPDGGKVVREVSRESWSNMRDSVMPNLDSMVSETDTGKNQAKFLSSAINKGKKKSLFSSIFSSAVNDEELEKEDCNSQLRRVTQSHTRGAAMAAAKARDEISKMNIYDAMLLEDE